MTGIECRIASLRAFIEARDRQLELSFGDDNCGRQEGGKFGPGNSCQEENGGQGVVESIRRQAEVAGVASFTGSNVPKAFGKAKSVRISDADDALKVFDGFARSGMTLDKAIAMTPGAKEKDADVRIRGTHRSDGSGYISAEVSVPLDIPADHPHAESGRHAVRVKTDIERFTEQSEPSSSISRSGLTFDAPVRSALHLDLLSVSASTQGLIVDGHKALRTPEADRTPEQVAAIELSARMERQISSKMLSMMVEAISAAEEAGVDAIYTYAAGVGSGSTNLGDNPDTYRGYALWGRFGLDGVIVKPGWGGRIDDRLAQIADRENHPERGVLTDESWQKYQDGKPLTLQDLMETKQGERFWRQYGVGAYLAMNLKDKNSKGYQRFIKLKKAATRAGNSRAFFWWLAEYRGDPMDYFKIERRNCGTGSGGFQKGNDCGGKSGGSADQPLDANDPEAVKAFIAKMAKETGLDIHGRPTAKGSPRPTVDPQDRPKSLHQQRLEAAGKWSDSEGAEKNRLKQAKFQESMSYHDDIDPLKDLLRSSGLGWGGYAQQANEFVRKSRGTPQQTTKKEFNRKAAEAAAKGEESFAEFLDSAGMTDLAKKLRAKREQRNCGTGSGGFQKGNTCAGQAAADVAGGAVKGAVVGAAAAVGKTGAFPPAVAGGAAAGAAIGAVKGLYDNRMRPTRAGKAIKAIGTTDEQVASMVKGLGGSPKSVAEADGKSAVTLSIKGKDGKSQFDVRMTKSEVRIKPSSGRRSLTAGDIKQIKKIAEENSPKSVKVVVDAVPTSVLAKVVRAGASLAVDATGALVAAFVVPSAPAIAGTAIEATTGMQIEKTKAAKWVGEKVLGNIPKRR